MGNGNGKQNRTAAATHRWRQLFVNPGNDPTRTLTRAYMLALGLIAFLTISGHIVTAHITDQQKTSAEIAYHIGRQRALMQQIMLYANNYYRLGEALDYDFMMQSVADLENGHRFLLRTIDEKSLLGGYASPALHRVYHSPPFNLDDNVRKFHDLLEQYAKFEPDDKSKERKAIIDRISYLSTSVLRPAMDAALEYYQTEILQKIARYYSIQLAGAIFILIVLALEAFLIFRPLINRLKHYNQVLQRYALEDSLTGLNNRRAFMNRADAEVKRAMREEAPIAVALLDLDHFKQVNDTYGHEVGDTVLRHFSSILRSAFRAGDITGRIGGEEFAIVLPRTDKDSAHAILKRLCDTVASTPCPYKNEAGGRAELHYTISIGFTAPAKITDENIDSLLSTADTGLYDAKEQGRNRVIAVD